VNFQVEHLSKELNLLSKRIAALKKVRQVLMLQQEDS
jgi:hypothetical protein